MKKTNINIAMLIDGDNAQAKYLQDIISETSKHGRITIKRIYGDWRSDRMTAWIEQLVTHSIKPIQKFAYTKGKNATDIALIIEAMDILHRDKIDGFCIVSSDSDFTGLANRIRESGLFVIGIGKIHTPKSFVNACDNFTYTESFEKESSTQSNFIKKKNKYLDISLLKKAFDTVKDDSGIAYLSQVATELRYLQPSFNTKEYGYKNYNSMFQALDQEFEVIYQNDNSTILIKEAN